MIDALKLKFDRSIYDRAAHHLSRHPYHQKICENFSTRYAIDYFDLFAEEFREGNLKSHTADRNRFSREEADSHIWMVNPDAITYLNGEAPFEYFDVFTNFEFFELEGRLRLSYQSRDSSGDVEINDESPWLFLDLDIGMQVDNWSRYDKDSFVLWVQQNHKAYFASHLAYYMDCFLHKRNFEILGEFEPKDYDEQDVLYNIKMNYEYLIGQDDYDV